MDLDRVLNIASILRVRSMDEDGRKAFDKMLDNEPVAAAADGMDDPDWRPDWWISDPGEQMAAHQAHMGQYTGGS